MKNNARFPLVADLDGTLTFTDTLHESIIQLIKERPLYLFLLPFWLIKGRAYFKSKIASLTRFSVELLPLNEELISYLKSEKRKSRRIFLATAAHESIAKAVAERIAIFDGIFATDNSRNLKGDIKLEAIKQHLGEDFVYAGDSSADIPIWRAARGAILVGTSRSLTKKIRQDQQIEKEFPKARLSVKTWLKALRVHQWLKNVLLFVPLLTAFSFTEWTKLLTVFYAFFSFSLVASATYILNDLWDLPNDRAHPKKKLRPFASSVIPIRHGLIFAVAVMATGFFIGSYVSSGFLMLLFLYLLMTTIYSLVLKKYVLIDMIMLSLLYTFRIFAGAVAINVTLTSWLLAFSMFMFLSLALVKRCSEIVGLKQRELNSIQGRDYRVSDLSVLWPLGVGSALSAVVVFCLFINAPETQSLYASPALLWVGAVGLFYWLSRLWIKTARGEMHDDPVIYAVVDRGSRATVLLIVATVLVSHFVRVDFLP